ncbi:Glu-tRNA(Gln) amidotransferase subunit GatE [archaeon]|nr:Glu-tRNA(Gln) amidotransferase subunit GatE [archaeon]
MQDYNKIRLKIGLEIHRQIDSNKLFCNCPSKLGNDVYLRVKRELRAVESELEEKDVAAEYEAKRKRFAVYEYSKHNACLVELDEEPIHKVNEDALKTVLEIAKFCGSDIVDDVQVMRKQVINYSNTSGFQRTMLIAHGGSITVNGKKIGIQNICLEEDAAREIKTEKDHVVYRLDRLGIPLIEITTDPDIFSPEEAKDVAEYIGMLLKSTGKFKSGLGTIRQDLNLSIKKGARTELKGVQDLRNIPKICEKEIERQLKLKKVEKEVRNINKDFTSKFLRPMPGSARMYPETDHPIILTKDYIKELQDINLIIDKEKELVKKYDLRRDVSKELSKINFEDYLKKYKKLDSKLIAKVLVDVKKDFKSRHKINVDDYLDLVLDYLNKGDINEFAVEDVLLDLSKGKKIIFNKYKKINMDAVKKEIKKLKNRKLSDKAIMGLLMKEYKGRISGKELFDLIK